MTARPSSRPTRHRPGAHSRFKKILRRFGGIVREAGKPDFPDRRAIPPFRRRDFHQTPPAASGTLGPQVFFQDFRRVVAFLRPRSPSSPKSFFPG